MSRFRKIEVRIWNDMKFRKLSRDAKLLFLMLLTHPSTTPLGFGRWHKSSMAEELGWDTDGVFETAFAELQVARMVAYDRSGPLYWMPNFLKYNLPANPNVVVSWASLPDLIPEGNLKGEILYSTVQTLREECSDAFFKALPCEFREELQRMSDEGWAPGIGSAESFTSAKSLSTNEVKAFREGFPKTGAGTGEGAGAAAPAGDAAAQRVSEEAAPPAPSAELIAAFNKPQPVQAGLLPEAVVPTGFTSGPDTTAAKVNAVVKLLATKPPKPCEATSPKGKASSVPPSQNTTAAAITGRKGRPATELPVDFNVSDYVCAWAKENAIPGWALPLHLKHFISYAKAHGKLYMDWDEALCNAIRGNWARLNYSRLAALYGEGSEERRKTAESIFAFWCAALDKGERSITQLEIEVLMARLAEGLSEETLKATVSGVKRSAFHTGDNHAGVRFDDIHVIFRDRAQALKLAGMLSSAPTQHSVALQGVLSPAAQRTFENAMAWVQRRIATARAAEASALSAAV